MSIPSLKCGENVLRKAIKMNMIITVIFGVFEYKINGQESQIYARDWSN